MDAVGDNAPDDATLLRCDDDGLIGFVMRNKPDDAFVLLTFIVSLHSQSGGKGDMDLSALRT